MVVRKIVDEDAAQKTIERKKTAPFGLLKKPDAKEVRVESVLLYYEQVMMITGRYTADYYRAAVHQIKVDHNVTEVVLGGGVFPVEPKSGWKKALSGKKAKNSVDLILEEHAFIDEEQTVFFDHAKKEIKFNLRLDAKNLENYPEKILEGNKHVRKSGMTDKEVIDLLISKLDRPSGPKIRDLKEKMTIGKIAEIYVPVYEARLAGPKGKAGILRLDAVADRIL